MERSEYSYRKIVLVCINERTDGRGCCASKGAVDLRHELKLRVAALDPTIRVSKAGCLGTCSDGPNVLVMPDNVWFKHVTMNDVDEIVQLIVS